MGLPGGQALKKIASIAFRMMSAYRRAGTVLGLHRSGLLAGLATLRQWPNALGLDGAPKAGWDELEFGEKEPPGLPLDSLAPRSIFRTSQPAPHAGRISTPAIVLSFSTTCGFCRDLDDQVRSESLRLETDGDRRPLRPSQ